MACSIGITGKDEGEAQSLRGEGSRSRDCREIANKLTDLRLKSSQEQSSFSEVIYGMTLFPFIKNAKRVLLINTLNHGWRCEGEWMDDQDPLDLEPPIRFL